MSPYRQNVSRVPAKPALRALPGLELELARYCVERREATLAEVQAAAWAFENIADEPAALDTLQRLCSR